jgi:transcriptional regulator with XRE-family HTH domain
VRTNHPLRQRRQELGLTQAEVARRAEIPVPSLSRIETGKSGVSTATLIRLARVLGLHSLAAELDYWTGPRS